MTRLALAAKRIGSGDYRAKVEVSGRDEVGQLATAFNQMTAAIGEREERLSHQADHDRLTDLPNRRMLERILTSEIESGGGVIPVTTLALVGVDRLPEINNTLGHDLGDQLIQGIGPMIDQLKPEGAVLARVSEAVFALLLPGRGAEHAKPIAQAITHAFDHPVRVGSDLAIDANVHIGLATAPQHGLTARTLLQHADVALFGARGSGAITVYDPATDPYKPENLSLMGELRGGIQRGELQLHFQPKIGLGLNKMVGAEALVRWIHPKLGFLPPDRFIPLAEESGAIHHLTDWALGSGIHHAKRWREGGLDLKLAVNLSVRDLLNKNLPDLTQRLLSESGMSGDRFILEITESAIMSDPDAAMVVLRRLADQGIKLSVDDFGTGHSSFAYLRKLPISELKIDKSFVLNLSKNAADQTIVRTIVDLAHGLDLKVTAEGVEDQDTYNLLAEFGCDVGQGYFMSRPLTLEKFEAFARDSAYAA
jgi:diguanylate cyclase (GGDEF)-like protein